MFYSKCSGDNGFVLLHAIVSYSLLVLALVLNATVFILVKFSKKITDFRYVFYNNCVANTICAAVFSITLMQWIFLPGLAVFFPTGPFAHDMTLSPIVFRIQTLIYIYVMCLVCSTFVYRYLIVVRPNVRGIKAKAMSSLLFIPVLLWFLEHSRVTISPDSELRTRVSNMIGDRFALDFQKIHMFVIATNKFQFSLWNVARLTYIVFQLNLMNFIMIWAGIRIYQTIQKSVGSQQSKIMEKNALRLLLSQAINPIILLHGPTFLNFIQGEITELPEIVGKVSCVLMSLFTITNPLLNLIFSRDLTKSLKDGHSMRKKSSMFVSTEEQSQRKKSSVFVVQQNT